MKKKVTAIIAAAGSGRRMGARVPKPFVKIAGRPILEYSLGLLEKSPFIDEIILVLSKDCLKQAGKFKQYKKLRTVVAGGAARGRSVYNGLCASNSCDIILIHDAARPLLSHDIIKRCVSQAKRSGACIAAVPVKATIKSVNFKKGFILTTPQRSRLWEAQTPQVFKKNILARAYEKLGKKAWSFKDDASLVEACGYKVKVVRGNYSNIKITTKEDLKIAEALLQKP